MVLSQLAATIPLASSLNTVADTLAHVSVRCHTLRAPLHPPQPPPLPSSHQVPTVDDPHFWELMDKMVSINNKLSALSNGTSTTPALLQPLEKLALYERMASLLLRVWAMPSIQSGSYDYENQAEVVY